jgi:hypothetical protein
MAKKKKQTVVEETIVEDTVVKEPTIKTPKVVLEPKKPKWEVKDRLYNLKGNKKPISYAIRSSNIFWFDEEEGVERELKYCSNQRTCFVDEMKGDQRLEHIIFDSGSLFVPKEKVVLQKLLSLYHPHKDKLFYEHNPVKIAESQLDWLEFEVEALGLAKNMDIDMAEAILRAEIGSDVTKMSSKELRRDLLLFAKENPKLFIELAADENVHLRNFGIKAVEARIISLSPDQRHFVWGSNNRKLMTVPFDEHPYSALAQWFKTDEGLEVYKNIEKRMS